MQIQRVAEALSLGAFNEQQLKDMMGKLLGERVSCMAYNRLTWGTLHGR